MQRIIVGEVYRHYKGGLYQVICIAEHVKTGVPLVVYRTLNQKSLEKIWCRPLTEFHGRVRDGDENRFHLLSNDPPVSPFS
jgi:hypothetical protein